MEHRAPMRELAGVGPLRTVSARQPIVVWCAEPGPHLEPGRVHSSRGGYAGGWVRPTIVLLAAIVIGAGWIVRRTILPRRRTQP
jgi:hypothetical protein